MGAITGIIGEPRASAADIERALLQPPRCSPANGHFIFRSPGVLLAHHAIKQSTPGSQSFFEDANHVIVGDVSDIGEALDVYQRFGDDCPNHLDGDFAFAIWDKHRHRLFAATDHFGARPLFFSDAAGCVVFSSDMGVINAMGLTSRRFDESAILELFLGHYSGATYDAEVRSLPGGTSLVATPSSIQTHKYWRLEPIGKYRFQRDEDWSDCLRELVMRAVRNRLRDRRVAVLLSGGLDSSFIAAVAAKVLNERNEPLVAFSNVLPTTHRGPGTDERSWIEKLGRHLPNLEQHWIAPSPEVGPLTSLEDTFAQVHAIANNYHYVDRIQCEAARASNVGILLSGLGGDFAVSYPGERSSAKATWSMRTLIASQMPAVRRLYRWWRDRHNIDRELTLRWPMKDQLIQRGYYPRLTHRERLARYVGSGAAGIHFGQLHSMGSHYGVSYCMPLWDRHLLEFFMDVPPDQFRLGDTRRSLARRAMKGLVPEEIVTRTDKQAFSPDSFLRFRRQEAQIRTLLENQDAEPAWKYVDRNAFTTELDRVLSMSNPPPARRALLCATVFVIAFVAWLQRRGYQC